MVGGVFGRFTGVPDLLRVRLSAGGGGAESEGEPGGLGAVGRGGAHRQQHPQGETPVQEVTMDALCRH